VWRFRKVFGRGPFRWTLSKRGIGWSWGIPGLRYGISPSGQRYISLSIPGTGLYWIKYFKQKNLSSPPPAVPGPPAGSVGPSPNPIPPPATPTRKVPWWKQKGL
jgi:hypothetical protein